MSKPSGSSETNTIGGQNPSQKRLQQTQAQVDEVVGIMRVNVEKVLERDQKLTELDQRADALQHGASQFEQQAGKLKRKQWWANMKMMIIMGCIGVFLVIIIAVSLWPSGDSSPVQSSKPNN
ncbi:synaptobrevin-1 isoform X3 [Sitodiplosis mosellana]|uniref:synaptobrevin-1 isoform X3 n=1 Tax=Sitodiplosis mosellana TaxID=263140 RepID=UPI002445331C|nr:synaptobrevin-1 isoform X3 [Sitodiplosis mosellana]XP_055320557.1 synaptobrevin-1 isoform X3 [Sitodiplosis mosellana]